MVCFNKQIGDGFYRLGLEFRGTGARAFARVQPGQFAEIDLAGVALPPQEAIAKELFDRSQRKILLRRPFSFSDIRVKGEKTTVDILYCVVGPASLRMTTLSGGDVVSVIGPLGRGFWVPEGKRTALLVVGGMGAGPLEHLAKILTENHPDVDVTAFAGAKTAKGLPFERRLDEISQELGFSLVEFARYGVKSMVATDDGTAGYEGFITDCFAQWLSRHKVSARDTIIYTCGPEAMLLRMAKIAGEHNIDCQISMERMMACGIGLCQSCAVECRVNGSNEMVYKLCCRDGPVFGSREIYF